MTRKADFADFRYVGKEGKLHVVTDGIRTRRLDNREFRQFSKQLFGFAG